MASRDPWNPEQHLLGAGALVGCGYAVVVALQWLALAWVGQRVDRPVAPVVIGVLRLLTGLVTAMAGTGLAALVYRALWQQVAGPGFVNRHGLQVIVAGVVCWAASILGSVIVRIVAVSELRADRFLEGGMPLPLALALPPVVFALVFHTTLGHRRH